MAAFNADKLKEKLEEKGISIFSLEKKAGVNTSIVRNIIKGRSKNPTIENLLLISKYLGCSIYDFLDEESPHKNTNELEIMKQNLAWNASLFADCVLATEEACKNNQISFSFEKMLEHICEIYAYSLESTETKADRRFADWRLKKIKIQTPAGKL